MNNIHTNTNDCIVFICSLNFIYEQHTSRNRVLKNPYIIVIEMPCLYTKKSPKNGDFSIPDKRLFCYKFSGIRTPSTTSDFSAIVRAAFFISFSVMVLTSAI